MLSDKVIDYVLESFIDIYANKEREQYEPKWADMPAGAIIGGMRGLKLLLNEEIGYDDPIIIYTTDFVGISRKIADVLYKSSKNDLTRTDFGIPGREARVFVGIRQILIVLASTVDISYKDKMVDTIFGLNRQISLSKVSVLSPSFQMIDLLQKIYSPILHEDQETHLESYKKLLAKSYELFTGGMDVSDHKSTDDESTDDKPTDNESIDENNDTDDGSTNDIIGGKHKHGHKHDNKHNDGHNGHKHDNKHNSGHNRHNRRDHGNKAPIKYPDKVLVHDNGSVCILISDKTSHTDLEELKKKGIDGRIHDVKLPGEYGLKKIVYTVDRRRVTIYNAGSFELIPYNINNEQMIAIDAVKARFLLIEDNSSVSMKQLGILKFAVILTTSKLLSAVLTEEYPDVDHIYGYLQDSIVYKKTLINDSNRVQPYYPSYRK